MDFEWEPGKARDNPRKHGVDFADAVIALEDENALTIGDPGHAEPRFETPGMGPTLNVLFVVHCERSKDCIRIVSARKATRRERRYYFHGLSHQ